MKPLRKRMLEDMQLKGYAAATQAAYVHAVGRLAKHYHKSPELITEEELRGYLLGLQKEVAHRTLQIALAGIRFFFETTLQKSWPVLEFARAYKERPLPVVLSQAEVRSILGAVRAPVYRICLSTIYSCGLRISEAAALQCGDVDSQRMLLRVRGKGNKDRYVPLAGPTLESLRGLWKLHRSKPWLFPARLQPRSRQDQGPIATDNLRIAFHAARKRSGVSKPAHVHTLRHSYATHLMEAGVQLRLIQEILGHNSPSTTAIYTHLTQEVLSQVTAPLQRLVQNL
jgi:integrase/recombinase XerD